MIFSRRWLLLFALGILPFLLTAISSLFIGLGILWVLVLFLLAIFDYRRLPNLNLLTIERIYDEKIPLNSSCEVRIRILNNCGVPLNLEIRDSPPENLPNDLTLEPFLLSLAENQRQSAVYHITAKERGDHIFGDLYLRIHSKLGLVQKVWKFPLPTSQSQLRIYPTLEKSGTSDSYGA